MIDRTSFLFITLDSCRFDTFEATPTPNLDELGPLHQAMAPGNFTFASHAAMFVGFTPGLASSEAAWLNPKRGKIFKIVGGGYPSKGNEFVTLRGKNIVDGLKRQGFTTLGTGAVGWFDDRTVTAQPLTGDFDRFFFSGNCWSLDKQLGWIDEQLAGLDGKKVFVFLNIGETHVPYYYEGAPWDRQHNPCRPFADDNDAEECRRRQALCLEWVDERIGPLLDRFAHANTICCADHGDAWGEDGLWEHGIHHPTVLEVPLLYRLQNAPVTMAGTSAAARRGVRSIAKKVRDKLK